ncbi:hypothetical protein BC940DRAFT_368724 [Gongronella butleri]|nr:hypothetical protein BC940DRAFT_368724 [Gongronella butleri]
MTANTKKDFTDKHAAKLLSLQNEHDAILAENNLTTQDVERLHNQRMQLTRSLADLTDMTRTLAAQYGRLKELSLKEVYEFFDIDSASL